MKTARVSENYDSEALGIASLVCGIISAAACMTAYIGVPLGVIAVIMGIISRRRGKRTKYALVGVITGVAALVLSSAAVLMIVFMQNFSVPNYFGPSIYGMRGINV